MIKKIVFVALVSLYVPHIFADELQDNLRTCASVDETFMQRFGQYIVATEKFAALNICFQKAWPSRNLLALPAGCEINGKWFRVGYYCQNR